MIDLGKFLTILMLFESGFTVLIVAMNQPYHTIVAQNEDLGECGTNVLLVQVDYCKSRFLFWLSSSFGLFFPTMLQTR